MNVSNLETSPTRRVPHARREIAGNFWRFLRRELCVCDPDESEREPPKIDNNESAAWQVFKMEGRRGPGGVLCAEKEREMPRYYLLALRYSLVHVCSTVRGGNGRRGFCLELISERE